MSSEEFYTAVYRDVPTEICNIVLDREISRRHDAGIYIYGVYTEFSQIIYLTFLDSEGISTSIEFMTTIRTRIYDVLYELLDKFSRPTISIAITDWSRESCDILSICEDLYSDGVLVYDIDGMSDLLHYVVNGRRVS